MFLRLFLLFAIIPVVEIYLMMILSARIGWGSTIVIAIVTGFIGAALAKREGLRSLSRIKQAFSEVKNPAPELLDGALVLVAGVLLVTPGFLTDISGFALLLPPFRATLRQGLSSWFKKQKENGNIHVNFGGGGVPPTDSPQTKRPASEEVIDVEAGEVRDAPPESDDI